MISKTNHTPKIPEPHIPSDLRHILAATAKAQLQWKDLTPIARRDFISWIDSAKQPETRKRRVDRVPNMLASGKRRPCCYAIVPMNLYKALGGTPRAKAQWKVLTPTERRDFSDWVESAKDTAAHRDRVEKVCMMLIAGKRRP